MTVWITLLVSSADFLYKLRHRHPFLLTRPFRRTRGGEAHLGIHSHSTKLRAALTQPHEFSPRLRIVTRLALILIIEIQCDVEMAKKY